MIGKRAEDISGKISTDCMEFKEDTRKHESNVGCCRLISNPAGNMHRDERLRKHFYFEARKDIPCFSGVYHCSQSVAILINDVDQQGYKLLPLRGRRRGSVQGQEDEIQIG